MYECPKILVGRPLVNYAPEDTKNGGDNEIIVKKSYEYDKVTSPMGDLKAKRKIFDVCPLYM